MEYKIGVAALDQLFGGYQPGVLHCLYGETMAGKTTLGSYVPIGLIAKSKGGVLAHNEYFYVVDCDGGFDTERALQVWSGMGLDAANVLKHLVYYNPTEFDEQHKVITELEQTIKKRGNKCLFATGDAISAIYRGILIRTDVRDKLQTLSSYTGKLDAQLMALRKLAVNQDCPVTVTSWPASRIANSMGTALETPLIGGRAFGFLPKIIIELRVPSEGKPVREAYLKKHRSRPVGTSCLFKLAMDGVGELTPLDL